MPQKIFINLPVRNLRESVDFFEKLGFTFNAQFQDWDGHIWELAFTEPSAIKPASVPLTVAATVVS